jgi:hypothetical protein
MPNPPTPKIPQLERGKIILPEESDSAIHPVVEALSPVDTAESDTTNI